MQGNFGKDCDSSMAIATINMRLKLIKLQFSKNQVIEFISKFHINHGNPLIFGIESLEMLDRETISRTAHFTTVMTRPNGVGVDVGEIERE